MDSLVIEGCAVATVDGTAAGVITAADTGAEHESGHLVLSGGRIGAVGAGPAPTVAGARVIDGGGCLATPGLIGTHHHLFQGLTRGQAQDGSLVRWLTTLYPQWARLVLSARVSGGDHPRRGAVDGGYRASLDHQVVHPSPLLWPASRWSTWGRRYRWCS